MRKIYERERERENHLVRVTNNSLSFVILRVKGLTLRTSGGLTSPAVSSRDVSLVTFTDIQSRHACVTFYYRRRRVEDQCGSTRHDESFQTMDYILFSMHIYEDHEFYRTRFLSFHFLCKFYIK